MPLKKLFYHAYHKAFSNVRVGKLIFMIQILELYVKDRVYDKKNN
jgi:hypothetical protein